MKVSIVFEHLSSSSTLVLLLVAVWQLRWMQGHLKLIFWVAVSSVLADAISLLFINYSINTWPVGNLFLIIQFVLFFVVLVDQERNKLLRICFYGCLGFSLVNFLFLQTPTTSNSYTFYATGILMIIAAISFLYNLMSEMPVEKVQTLPLFWLAFGVLVYYGGTLFLFLFNNYLIAHLPKIHQNIWVLHNLLNITKNIFLFMTLWVNYKSKTSPS